MIFCYTKQIAQFRTVFMDQVTQIKHLLAVPKKIVITAHRNPDGDALGASLALSHFLEKFLHTVTIIFPSEYPYNFEWMHGAGDIVIYDIQQEESIQHIKEAEIIFALDYNSLDRVDKMGIYIQESDADKILIDHHIDPEPFADFIISHPEASSTSELIYEFILDLGEKKKLDELTATYIYTGILTDTGSFRHNTSSRLFEIIAHLKELGIDDWKINDSIYNSLQEKHLRLLGHCLYNRMEVLSKYGAAIISLTKEDYQKYDIQRGDTEGIVNYMLMMKNIRLAAFITEQPTIVKLSLRSKGDISVQQLARDHFNGGGHKNAAGGSSFQSLDKAIEKFKSVLPQYVKNAIEL